MRKLWILASVLILTGLTQAQSVPDFVNYQGRLTDEGGAPLATGDYALRFEVYDDPVAGSRVWGPLCFDTETGDTPLDNHKFKVPVVQGYFNVVLDRDNGYTDCTDTTPDGDGLAAPVSTAFTAALRYVEVAVWNETGSVWEPILPRQHVLSSPYAVSADRSREVVSAEGQPTRIACKTGPSTEVDVVTVSDTGVGVEGDLGVTGAVGFTGPLDVVGDVDVTGNAQVSGDLQVDGALHTSTKPIIFSYFFPNGNAIVDTGFLYDDYNVAVVGLDSGVYDLDEGGAYEQIVIQPIKALNTGTWWVRVYMEGHSGNWPNPAFYVMAVSTQLSEWGCSDIITGMDVCNPLPQPPQCTTCVNHSCSGCTGGLP